MSQNKFGCFVPKYLKFHDLNIMKIEEDKLQESWKFNLMVRFVANLTKIVLFYHNKAVNVCDKK